MKTFSFECRIGILLFSSYIILHNNLTLEAGALLCSLYNVFILP